MGDLIGVEELAERWSCSVSFVRKRVRDGSLHATKPAKRVLIAMESVRAYEAAQAVEADAPNHRQGRPPREAA